MADKEKDIYQDFGEKIGGAKKDRYGIQVSDLDEGLFDQEKYYLKDQRSRML